MDRPRTRPRRSADGWRAYGCCSSGCRSEADAVRQSGVPGSGLQRHDRMILPPTHNTESSRPKGKYSLERTLPRRVDSVPFRETDSKHNPSRCVRDASWFPPGRHAVTWKMEESTPPNATTIFRARDLDLMLEVTWSDYGAAGEAVGVHRGQQRTDLSPRLQDWLKDGDPWPPVSDSGLLDSYRARIGNNRKIRALYTVWPP